MIDHQRPIHYSPNSHPRRSEDMAGIDARGQKEVDVQSTNQLWGALLPNLVLGLLYVAAFLHFRRDAHVLDVYDPKRRRLMALEKGRGHPTIRGLPDGWRERSPSLTPTPLPPPDVPASPWSWFVNLWRVSDPAIITYTGADAYMFLRFLRVGCVSHQVSLPSWVGSTHMWPIYLSIQLLGRARIHPGRADCPPARPRARGQRHVQAREALAGQRGGQVGPAVDPLRLRLRLHGLRALAPP